MEFQIAPKTGGDFMFANAIFTLLASLSAPRFRRSEKSLRVRVKLLNCKSAFAR